MTDSTVRIIHADCLDAMRAMDDESIDFIYLDPPFNTGRTMRADAGEYEDAWSSVDAYLEFLRPRIDEMHRLLNPTGSIMLHCDWRVCHHLRIALDEIFGPEHFINHLIWRYGLGGSSPRRYARKHDDILFYGRTSNYYFDPPRVPATSNRMKGQTKKATDVLDIPAINNMALERTGYPTQKPLALLETLIASACPPGGTVLDPFAGSGTSAIAALAIDRSAIAIDKNPAAVKIMKGRMVATPFDRRPLDCQSSHLHTTVAQ